MTSAIVSRGKQKKKKLTKKEEKEKKAKKRKIYLGIASVVGLIIWWGTKPFVGTMQYGICKVFIETQLYYPQTLRINSMDNFDKSLRIYYTYIDPYGQSRMDFAECTFRPSSGGVESLLISNIKINRVLVDPEKIDAFNQTIPSILAYPPDLVIPIPKDALQNIIITPKPNFLK